MSNKIKTQLSSSVETNNPYSYLSTEDIVPTGFIDNNENFYTTQDLHINHSFLDLSSLFSFKGSTSLDIKPSATIRTDLEQIARRMVASLKSYPFENGSLSFVDMELQALMNDFNSTDFLMLLSKIWVECYSSSTNDEIVHFLNCLSNLTYHMDPDIYMSYASSATSHKNIAVKEAGIAWFEKVDNPKYKAVLDKIDTCGVSWLETYKQDVIKNLGT